MKSIYLFGVLLVTATLQAQTSSQTTASTSTLPPPTSYAVVSRDANSAVWQQQTYDQGPNGTIVTNIHRYVELATGLNHLVNRQYVPSTENIAISPDGSSAMATNGQHQLFFPGNIYNGDIKLVTPDNQAIESQPIALAYSDGNNSVLLATVTNSTGAILPSGNQVIYTNAFAGLDADLIYTYTKAGMEQDIVLQQQPPDPASFNLNPQATKLQMITEFTTASPPSVTATTVPTDAGNLEDDSLSFGAMVMGRGKAFFLGTNSPSVGVEKRWVTLNGRQFLIEEVPIVSIATAIDSLPPFTAQTGSGKPVVSKNLVLPPPRLVHSSPKTRFLAQAEPPDRGLVLDYVTFSGGVTNYTFRGDTTYYLSSGVYLTSGTFTFEGGAVLKYARSAALGFVVGPPTIKINWLASAYRPVILTAADDGSVGDAVTTNSPSGYYANPALEIISANTKLNHLRVRYAQLGLEFVSNSGLTVSDAQLVNCQQGVLLNYGNIVVENALFANVLTNFSSLYYATIRVQNATMANSVYLETGQNPPFSSGSTLSFTNCIFANITNYYNSADTFLGDHNGFYHFAELWTNPSTNNFYPFQAVGAGNYYLTNGCNFFNAGTTNIDPPLLADIQTKTTYPPILLTNTTVSANTALNPQAQRDTDTPDLGYHYDPIDYLVDQFWVTNAVLTVTNGAAIACYNDSGVNITDGSSISSVGTPTAPNWFVEYSSVQEQPLSLGPGGYLAINPWHTSAAPNGFFRFTKFACPGAGGYHLYDAQASSIYTNLWVQDCEFWGGGNMYGGGTNTVATLVNNLFARSTLSTYTNIAPSSDLLLTNNLFWGVSNVTIAPLGAAGWSAYNNAFDSCGTISSGTGGLITNGYNAYLNCTNYLQPTNSTDVFTNNTLAYQTSWFGTFYQPTNSPLIRMGSTTADQVGLYHYAVTTNEVVEGTNTVSIGYHYVATDTNGIPLDSNGNGIPDYLEDPAGNGQPFTVTLIAPLTGSSYAGPTNILIQATVADWRNLVTNMEFFQGAIQITGMTNSPYTYTWPVVAGSYSLTAIGQDNGGVIATSTPVSVTITNQSLRLWLRADLGVTNNGSGQISTWVDQSGNTNNATQSTAGSKPLYVTNALNGLPVVHFDGTNYYFTVNMLNVMNNTTGAEALLVIRAATNLPTSNRGLWNVGGSGAAYWTYYPNTSGEIADCFGSAVNYNYDIGVPAQPLNQYHLYEVSAQTNNWMAWINGSLLCQETNYTYGYAPSDLGRTSGGVAYFAGDIAEILVFGRPLSSVERNTVYSYVNNKYALVTNAPAVPASLTATPVSTSQISLTWNYSLGTSPTVFTIEHKLGVNGVYSPLATVQDVTSYFDTSLAANTQYYYKVMAGNWAGQSGFSNETNATTLASAVDMPLNNLVLWVKADSAMGWVANGNVWTWFDQSGNHNDLSQKTSGYQPVTAYQPVYITNALNGRPAIQFNGTNDYFTMPNILDNTTGAEAFLVIRAATNLPAIGQGLWNIGSVYNNHYTFYPNTAGHIVDCFGSAVNYNYDLGIPTQPLNQYHLYDVSSQTSNWMASVNGVLQYQTNNNVYAVGPSDLGRTDDGGYYNYFAGGIAEVLVFNRPLTGAEKIAVGDYLFSKYNLSSYATNSVAPSSPTNLASAGLFPGQLGLQWARTSTNETAFSIERKTGSGGTYQVVGSTVSSVTNFVDVTAMPAYTNFYRIKALNYFGNSGYSPEISPPSVCLTNWPATILANTTNLIGAQAADANGTINTVGFYIGAANHEVLIGTDSSSPYTANWISGREGPWALAALATDNLGNSQYSSAVTLIVYLDSNGDGIPDYLQVLQGNDPLNPWTPPAGDTNSTPPTINLTVPANATLLP